MDPCTARPDRPRLLSAHRALEQPATIAMPPSNRRKPMAHRPDIRPAWRALHIALVVALVVAGALMTLVPFPAAHASPTSAASAALPASAAWGWGWNGSGAI